MFQITIIKLIMMRVWGVLNIILRIEHTTYGLIQLLVI